MHEGDVLALDARSGETITRWEAHAGSTCNTLALTADGTRLLTCSWDKNAHLWDTETRDRLATLDAGAGIYSCAISADGSLAALCCGKELQIWDVGQAQKLATCLTEQSFSCAVFLPDGKTVASADGTSDVRLWNVDSGECVAQLSGNGAVVRELAAAGKLLAGGATGEVVIWDVESRQPIRTVPVGDRSIFRLSFSADGKRLAVGTDAMVVIDPGLDAPLIRLRALEDDVYFVAFSPDGTRLAGCTTGGQVVICESEPLGVRH
jgi:WD40 repeat protein